MTLPELTAVATLALDAAAGAPAAEVPWPTLMAVARRERVQGIVYRLAADGAIPATPEQLTAAKDAYREMVAHTVRLFGLQLRLTRALAEQGIAVRILKGPAAAALDHPEPHDRLYGDLDLLVRSRDLDAAVAVVQAAGGQREMPPLRHGYDARFAKTVMLRVGEGFEVDVHRTITPEPFGLFIDEDELWADPQPFTIGRHTFQALSARNRFLHACYHAVLGGDDRVMPLADAMLLLHRVDTEEILAQAQRWRARAVVARATDALQRRLGLDPVHPLARWALAYRPTTYEGLVLRHTVDQRARQSWRTLLTLPYLDGWSQRRAYLEGVVWPSEAFLEGRGSSRSQWLDRGRRTVLSRLGVGR